jgi:inner membrane protein
VDNLTHTLVGAALGEAGLKRRTGLGMATLMIAANLPDVDVLSIPFTDSLAFRRGWTHGPLALVVLPVLLAVAVVGWDRLQTRRGSRPPDRLPVRPAQVLLLAVVGTLSHPFLDWLNTYGIRLAMPFSHEWFYGDAIFIIDPWIWAALGLSLVLARRRARRAAVSGMRTAGLGLGVVVVYVALMIAGSRAAECAALGGVGVHRRGPVERLMAGPVPINPLQRQLIFDTGEEYGFGRLSWTPRAEVELEAAALPKRLGHPAVRRALGHDEIQGFLYWSRFPFFEVDEHPDRFEVHVGDARFSRTARGAWPARSVEIERPALPAAARAGAR